jgi:GGDEF domain-containing protein
LDRLPGRPQAELALTAALEREQPLQVLVLVVNRLPLVNERFGYAVGDQILEAYSGRLMEELAEGDRLYRWSAAALIAFLGRPGVGKFGSKHAMAPSTQFEETIDLDSGPVRLRICASSRRYSVDSNTHLDDLIRSMDFFVATELEVG